MIRLRAWLTKEMFCVKNCKSLQFSLNFTKMVMFKSQGKIERPEIDLKFGLVAQLSQANPTASITEKDPYAELWMGTHPSGPSKIANSSELLLDYLKSNLNSLGDEERNAFGEDLPFLFKALSVAKALSIQAHPEKVCITIGPVIFLIS